VAGSDDQWASNTLAAATTAISQGVNILVVCFVGFNSGSNQIQPTIGGGGFAPSRQPSLIKLLQNLQKFRPTGSKPPAYGQALIFMSFGGADTTNDNIVTAANWGAVVTDVKNTYGKLIDGIDYDYEQGFSSTATWEAVYSLASKLKTEDPYVLSSSAPESPLFRTNACGNPCGAWDYGKLYPTGLDVIWPQIYDGTTSGRCDALLDGDPNNLYQYFASLVLEAHGPGLRLVAGLPIGRWWQPGPSCSGMKAFQTWPSAAAAQFVTTVANTPYSTGVMFWNIEWALGTTDQCDNTAAGCNNDSGFIKDVAGILKLNG